MFMGNYLAVKSLAVFIVQVRFPFIVNLLLEFGSHREAFKVR